MKGFRWIALLLASLFMLAACGGESESGGSASGNDGKALKLRASSGVPDKHFWHRGLFEPLTTTVSEETDGQVQFEVFTAGELVSLGNEMDALTSGSIDVALTLMPPYDPQRFPYSEVVMLPLLESDAVIAAEAMGKLMKSDQEIKDGKTYYELEYTDKGLVAFSTPVTEPYLFSTTKHKFDNVGEFNKAIRVRTASRVHEMLAKELGITGQSMPITDAYDALSRNALDGIIYNSPDWIAFGLDELIKYSITGVNFGHFAGATAMKESTWNKMTEEQQKIFTEKADEYLMTGSQLTNSETAENIAANEAKGGEMLPFDQLDPEVQKHLETAIVNVWKVWIDDLESQGHAGTEIALLWRDLLVEAGAQLPTEILELN